MKQLTIQDVRKGMVLRLLHSTTFFPNEMNYLQVPAGRIVIALSDHLTSYAMFLVSKSGRVSVCISVDLSRFLFEEVV